MSCPYQEQLSLVMEKTYQLGNINASLFATEGIASVGLYLAPLVALACGLVIAIGNRESAGLPPRFVLISAALLPQTFLNVPFTTALLTHGTGFLFLLWYIMPRTMFDRKIEAVRLRDRRVSMQSVLITGGAGFIGQNLVHAWRAARPADRLTVVDAMTYAANVRSLEPLIADRSIQFVKGDIGDAALMQRLFDERKFSRVAHLAAELHVDRSISDPEAFLQTNVLGTFTLLKAALDCWRAAGDARQRRDFSTSRPTRSMARSARAIPPSRKPRPTVRIRPTRRARQEATIWSAPSSRPMACRR